MYPCVHIYVVCLCVCLIALVCWLITLQISTYIFKKETETKREIEYLQYTNKQIQSQ